MKKGQMYLPQEREAATSAEKLGISHRCTKMVAKQIATAAHREDRHVVAAEAEPEVDTTTCLPASPSARTVIYAYLKVIWV